VVAVAVGDGVGGDLVSAYLAQDPPCGVAGSGIDDHGAHEVDVERVSRTAGEDVETGGELVHEAIRWRMALVLSIRWRMVKGSW
jgi:hypothetical protein